MRTVSTSLLVATLTSPAGAVGFPANAGYADIRTTYGARGDGVADDAPAFRKAAADDARRLYLPNGTYRVTDGVVLRGKRWILQGESQAGTVIRLADRSPGFDDPARPRPVVSTFGPFMDPKAAMGQAFRNSLFDLTIDTGAGNPGAVGLHYQNNNQGTVRNVTVRSGDPERRGKAGIALVTNWPGPALFDRVRVEGFDVGVWSTISQYGMVLDRVELTGQREAGILNTAQTLAVRRLKSDNRVPALKTVGNSSVVTLLDAELTGGAGGAAVEATDGAAVTAFNLTTAGYATAVRAEGVGAPRTAPGPKVPAFTTHPLLPTADAPLPRVETAVPDAPDPPLPPPHEWADVTAFGARPVNGRDAPDAGPAIQKAIDSGRSVVYFPFGTYAIRTPVRVRGRVARVIGMESRIRGLTGADPVWRVEDGDAPAVVFERMDGDYEATSTCYFEHASRRTLVLRQMMTTGYRNTVRGGVAFLDDVCGNNWHFVGQTVWARQLNPEAKDPAGFNIRAEESRLWFLGVKTEGPRTVLTARDCRTELWGGFFYASRGTDAGAPAIDLTGGSFVGNWVNHLGGSYRPQVRQRVGERADEFLLHVDFAYRNRLPLVRRLTRGAEVVEETTTGQRERGDAAAFRHGSYGVKVPLYVAPGP